MRLELYERKRSRTVLRGLECSNALRLPDAVHEGVCVYLNLGGPRVINQPQGEGEQELSLGKKKERYANAKSRPEFSKLFANWENKKHHSPACTVVYTAKTCISLHMPRFIAIAGATTPGVDRADTVDGMSLKRIRAIIESLRQERYRFKPVRRTEIPKKSGRGVRKLGFLPLRTSSCKKSYAWYWKRTMNHAFETVHTAIVLNEVVILPCNDQMKSKLPSGHFSANTCGSK